MKLLVDDKITAWVEQSCLLGFMCKVLNKKHCLLKHFAVLKNVCCALSNLSFFLVVVFSFASC